jgi:hypothetical protein
MIVQPSRPPPAHVRQLISAGYIGLALAAAYFMRVQPWQNTMLSAANVAMLVFGVLPMLFWLKRNDQTYPIVEFLLLTTVPFYAGPALTGHEGLGAYSEELLLKSALVVVAFQLSCIAASTLAARSYRPRAISFKKWWQEEILPESNMGFTSYTLTIFTVWMFVSTMTDLVPGNLTGTLRAVFFGLGIVSVFIQARLWGAGLLTPTRRSWLIANIVLQLVLTFVSLLLINGMSLVLTALLGYFSVARRVPWVPVLIAIPIFALLHNGKPQMRKIYWEGHEPAPTLTTLPQFFQRWIELGLASEKVEEDGREQALTYGLMRRASLFQILCIAVDTMPERAPFLNGASYTMIPSQIAPRFLWPNKPSPQLSVKLLSVQLGILSMEETETTSVGFGLLTEAYANFGFAAVSMLGATLGFLFRRLALATESCATISPAGLLRILSLVWILGAEVTLAVWVSSLYQACIAIGVPLMVFRGFLRG